MITYIIGYIVSLILWLGLAKYFLKTLKADVILLSVYMSLLSWISVAIVIFSAIAFLIEKLLDSL